MPKLQLNYSSDKYNLFYVPDIGNITTKNATFHYIYWHFMANLKLTLDIYQDMHIVVLSFTIYLVP